jgi:hypothetical protein
LLTFQVMLSVKRLSCNLLTSFFSTILL